MDDVQPISNEQRQNGSFSDSHSTNIYISCLTFNYKYQRHFFEFSKSLRNLGIIFDNSFSLHQNIMNTCRAPYIELRRISSIWHFLSVDATKTLMCSLVLSKLRYCNSLLSGSPQYLIQLFQKFKIQLLGLILEPQELNILHPSFIPFTGFLYKRESSTRSALFVMLH